MTTASTSPRRRYRTMVIWLGVLGVLGFVGYSYVSALPAYSRPGRLVGRLHHGMALREVRAEAQDLGFAWHVDERRLESGLAADVALPSRRSPTPPPGRIICHQRGAQRAAEAPFPDGYVCENLSDLMSFGAFFSSYACNLVIKDGQVAEFWLYMD